MRRFRLCAALLVVFSAACAFAQVHNAILVSFDGADRSAVRELLDRGALPAIKELKTQGALVDITVKGHDTHTGPGHAEMLTGLPPRITTVVSNWQCGVIPPGLTIFERLEKVFGREGIVTVAVMGKGGYMSSPYANAKKVIDVWDGDTWQPSEVVGEKALGYLDRYGKRRFFMFFHFVDTDSAGHGFGEGSPEYKEALIAEDTLVGRILEKLRELNIADRTAVYVTADHGFDPGQTTHDNAPDVFLATNDKTVKRSGYQSDIVPTILKRLGVDISKLVPRLPGKPLN